MLNDEQKTALIERSFDGVLTDDQQELFNRLMAEDVDFAAEAAFQQKFMNSMNRLGDELFLTNLQNLEQQIQTERAAKNNSANSLKNLADKALEKGGELLDDLLAAFLPIPQYETLLAATSRSDVLQVVSPENGVDCREGILRFELEERIDQNLQLSIEDNQQAVLIEKTISKQTIRFKVDIEALKAGRYYWKLKTKEDLVMGSFFIQKDLN